jgi:hypothetical protein
VHDVGGDLRIGLIGFSRMKHASNPSFMQTGQSQTVEGSRSSETLDVLDTSRTFRDGPRGLILRSTIRGFWLFALDQPQIESLPLLE